nr:YncE family protein [Candidatus Protofrankia californiensis]
MSAEGSGGAQPVNVYAFAGANQLSPAVRGAKELVYVPNSDSNTVDVIDPATFKVIDHFVTGRAPQHVVPAWDLSTLYVTNNLGNSLTPIDPTTGKIKGPNIPVADPYNMYFAPDGKYAIVVAEELQRLDFYDPHTWQLRTQVKVDCPGVDHVDFSADNSFFVATCEFSGKLVKVDLRTPSVVGYLTVEGMPQDIKLDPRGEVLYIADMMANGLHLVDPVRFQKIGFLATGKGAHGLYPNREATAMYVSNRGEGSVSVVDFTTRQVQRKWQIPGGGSPDMGGVSADGSVLWLTGRYNSEVYAISTKDGSLLARIKVGPGPHGACVWPQPGRYSLGHTGILR